MKHYKQQLGFTLIELMLVIALITAMSIIGVNAYKQQLVNFQIDKTALQMQQWLEGAAAFYVYCNDWPGDSTHSAIAQLEGTGGATCNGKSSVSNLVFVASGSIETDPWGGSYSIPAAAGSQYFQVKTSINVPQDLFNRIIARLPNAKIDATNNTIAAFITAPSQGGGSSGMNIVHVNDSVPSGTTIVPGQGEWPTCSGRTPWPHIYIAGHTLAGFLQTVGDHNTARAFYCLWTNSNVSANGRSFTPTLYTKATDAGPLESGNGGTLFVIETCEASQQQPSPAPASGGSNIACGNLSSGNNAIQNKIDRSFTVGFEF